MTPSNELPRYKTTDFVALPTPYNPGAEVVFRGWPKRSLEPVNDLARRISDYYKAHKGSSELPYSPFTNGKLYLPLLGLPMWRLGPSFKKREANAAPENAALMRALGHSVMGDSRTTNTTFTSDRWPEGDVEPMNEHARLIVEYMRENPAGPFEHPAWDSKRHCVNVPRTAEAA